MVAQQANQLRGPARGRVGTHDGHVGRMLFGAPQQIAIVARLDDVMSVRAQRRDELARRLARADGDP